MPVVEVTLFYMCSMGIQWIFLLQNQRDFDELKTFVEENLKPLCGPKNLELCEDEEKEEIAKYMAMKPEDLKKLIDEKDAELKKLNSEFDAKVDKISQEFEEAEKAKTDKVQEIKDAGLAMMKAVVVAAESS